MTKRTKNKEVIPPRADSLLESSRSYGYDLSTALSDIIDNSITANAKNIWILQEWKKEDLIIAIIDDGTGMNEDSLREAMRLGSISPVDKRDDGDLGRFGLGMKTASLSQCRRLTVASKYNDKIKTRCWDIDYVKNTEDWTLQTSYDNHSTKFIDNLKELSTGTAVIWQNLDRVIPPAKSNEGDLNLKVDFFNKLDDARRYIGMIFHRFLTGPKKINIFINSIDQSNKQAGKIMPWDPFVEKHKSTFNPIDPEKFQIQESLIKVTPFILPHKSKYSIHDDWVNAGGPYGWNAHQGFYLYREKRLIIFGSWLNLGYKKEDHYKLCRIRLDIDNSIDHLWKIDVKKSSAEVPDSLKRNLKRIAESSRVVASEIYRNKGQQRRRETTTVDDYVWVKRKKSGIPRYVLNSDHILLNHFIEKIGNTKYLKSLMKLIEKTVPIEQIIITNNDNPDAHVGIGLKDTSGYERYLPLFKKIFLSFIKDGLDKESAFNKAASIEPFSYYVEQLEALRENIDAS